MLIPLSAALLVAGCGQSPQAAMDASLPEVDVKQVAHEPLKLTRELPGRVAPLRIAEVRARVPGIVLRRLFEEGASVEAGQVLFEIDPAPFEMALARAEAEMARAEAVLYEAETALKRYEKLRGTGAISQQDLDSAQAAFRTARAARQAAKAGVDTAKLDLDYAAVKAPISGRIGRANVTEGALVGQDEATPLATIQQIDTVYVDFTQPVAEVLKMRAAASDESAGQDKGARSVTLSVEGLDYQQKGRLLFSDISVDQATGQVSLRGEFTNPDGVLLPGMYVRATIVLGVDPQAILIPQRAIVRSGDGRPQVMVVGDEGVVQARPVQTGVMAGASWQILSGLEPGDNVIVGGAVQPGQNVVIRSEAADGKG
ncbi:MAG: efflux RND transporter periplasmic adaptor subunit [Porticoccaceae bacterium]